MIESGPDRPDTTRPISPSLVRDDPIPLVRRYPALAAIPRARLGRFPTPVERLEGFRDVAGLWVKHEDRVDMLISESRLSRSRGRPWKSCVDRINPVRTSRCCFG